MSSRLPLAQFAVPQVQWALPSFEPRANSLTNLHHLRKSLPVLWLSSITPVLSKQLKTATSSAPIVRPCPVCSSDQSIPAMEKRELRIVRCQRCSMLYANPVPADFASGQYYDQEGADYYLSPAKLESDYSPVRFERELRLFRLYCTSGSILD